MFSRYFIFYLNFLVMYKNSFENLWRHNLVNKQKGNQTMKFGQLIEHNMRTIFLKIFSKCGGETIIRPFSKKSKFCLWVNRLKFRRICFYCILSGWLPIILKLDFRTLAFTFLPHFLHDFWRIIFILLFLSADHVSLSGCL